MNKLLPLGTKTKYGEIVAVFNRGGARGYFTLSDYGVVGLVRADILEETPEERTLRRLNSKLAKRALKNKGLRKRVAMLERRCAMMRKLLVGI